MRYISFLVLLFIVACSKEAPVEQEVVDPLSGMGRGPVVPGGTQGTLGSYASYSLEMDTIVDADESTSYNVKFPPFNPVLGTLDSIIIEASSTVMLSFAHYNTSPDTLSYQTTTTRFGKLGVNQYTSQDTTSGVFGPIYAREADTVEWDGIDYIGTIVENMVQANSRLAFKYSIPSYIVVNCSNRYETTVSDDRIQIGNNSLESLDRYKITYVYVKK